MNIATVDIVLLIVLLASVVIGAWRGLLYEVLSVLGWVAAFVLAQWLAVDAAEWLPLKGASEPLRYAAGFAVVFVAVAFAAGFLAWLVKKRVESVGHRPVDRTPGAPFGLVPGPVHPPSLQWVPVFPRLDRGDQHARCDHTHGQPGDRTEVIAEQQYTQHGHQHRLGLDIGIGHPEGALVHDQQHRCGTEDLRDRPQRRPAQRRSRQRRHGLPAPHQPPRQKQQREGQSEDEAHLRRPEHADGLSQPGLGAVAIDLGGGGSDRDRHPQQQREAAQNPSQRIASSIGARGTSNSLTGLSGSRQPIPIPQKKM